MSVVWWNERGTSVEWFCHGRADVLGEKPMPVPLCPPQISYGLARDRTRVSAVRGRRCDLYRWFCITGCSYLDRLPRSGLLCVPPILKFENSASANTLYLRVLCGAQKKQRLFPCTSLTGWFLYQIFNPLKPSGYYTYHQV